MRRKWGNQKYSDWTSVYYNDKNWGHSTEERKWKYHFQKYKDLPWIYIVLNNSLDRCIFNRKSILLGVSKKGLQVIEVMKSLNIQMIIRK